MRLGRRCIGHDRVSDGLSSEPGAPSVNRARRRGVLADRVPLSKELRSVSGFKRPAVEYALSGGEDYELLFTVPRAKLGRLRSLRTGVTRDRPDHQRTTRIMLVGENGRKAPLRPSGV